MLKRVLDSWSCVLLVADLISYQIWRKTTFLLYGGN